MLNDDIVSRIQKLMALADKEKNSNVNEAAIAAEKAQKLLQEHNLTMDEVGGFTVDRSKVIEVAVSEGGHNRQTWLSRLANAIAENNFCYFINIPAFSKHREHKYNFVGKRDNVYACIFMFNNLRTRLEALAEREFQLYKRTNPGTGAHGKTWKVSFYMGAVREIRIRLEKTTEEFTQTKAGNAIVLVRNAEIEEFKKINYPKTTFSNPKTRIYSDAYGIGQETGKNISFQSGISAGSPKYLDGK